MRQWVLQSTTKMHQAFMDHELYCALRGDVWRFEIHPVPFCDI